MKDLQNNACLQGGGVCGVVCDVVCGVVCDVVCGVVCDVVCGVVWCVVFGVWCVVCGVWCGVVWMQKMEQMSWDFRI
jgi:hypothetical protein